MPDKGGYIYIMSNKNRTVVYIGVTANLYSRVYQHKFEKGSSFTNKYRCHDLIYYEFYPSIEEAIMREKRLKKWKRAWKSELIKKLNPDMIDLFNQVTEMQ